MTARPLTIVDNGKRIGDEDLRQWLERYVSQHEHLTTNDLARSDHIGVSKTALMSYLAGTYFLSEEMGGAGIDPESARIEEKIRAYREVVEGTIREGYQNTFLETRSWQQFQHACNVAIREKAIVLIYAKPGTGKSRCLKQYSSEKMRTRPAEILCSRNITTRYFVQKIAQAIGIGDTSATPRLEDLISKKLKAYPRPLFVDQANYLHEKALGTICYLWETARIPIVLVGTHELAELFNRSSLTEDVRAQLTSRIAMHYGLAELSIDEMKTIITRLLGTLATPTVVDRIFHATEGNHRHLDMVLPRLSEMIRKNQAAVNSGDFPVLELVDLATTRLMVG